MARYPNKVPAKLPAKRRKEIEPRAGESVQHDMANQFRAAARAGNPARGLALLKKLDRQLGK